MHEALQLEKATANLNEFQNYSSDKKPVENRTVVHSDYVDCLTATGDRKN